MRITNVAHGHKSDKLLIKVISSANYKIQLLVISKTYNFFAAIDVKNLLIQKINTNKSSLLLSINDE